MSGNSNRIIRVVEEVPRGRLTPQERRVYLCRELAGLARDAGDLEFAEKLDKLGKFAKEHPIDGPPDFTFNIDEASSDEPDVNQPTRPVTTIAIKYVDVGLDGRPARSERSEPNDIPESGPVAPAGVPNRSIANNGGRAHCRQPCSQ